MKSKINRMGGFTTMEVAFIALLVVIFGVLAVTKYLDLSTITEKSVEEGVIAAVRQGLASNSTQQGRNGIPDYPATLDKAVNGAATTHNLFFGNVMEKGIAVTGWVKIDRNEYRTPSGKRYVYDPANGSFAYRDR
ncbi:MAG: hypothetical protein GY731_16955 [Gammaproteobacteria bacterium]|nr:hypothetical protein [Gammaproteobacteria bacterium]